MKNQTLTGGLAGWWGQPCEINGIIWLSWDQSIQYSVSHKNEHGLELPVVFSMHSGTGIWLHSACRSPLPGPQQRQHIGWHVSSQIPVSLTANSCCWVYIASFRTFLEGCHLFERGIICPQKFCCKGITLGSLPALVPLSEVMRGSSL